MSTDVIHICGKGLLADYVAEQLGETHAVRRVRILSGVPAQAKLGLFLYDDHGATDLKKAETVLQGGEIPWLFAASGEREGVVGPFVRPGTPGCSVCAEQRRSDSGYSRDDFVHSEVDEQDAYTNHWGLYQMSLFIAEEVRKFVHDMPLTTMEHIYCLDYGTMSASLHTFLPDPLCEVCSKLCDDSSEAARISLRYDRESRGSDSFRSRPLSELAEVLTDDYLDDRAGVLNGRTINLSSPYCDVMVSLPSLFGWTAGRSHSYKHSEQTAILEGLERYCGMTPRGKRTILFDTYDHLSDVALNPITLGLYSKEQYASPDFPFIPFDPETPIHWVWGYSLTRECPILVPEQVAYYGPELSGSLVSEGSNGCALGGSMDEAILHGLLEVVERDSFLLTWYARLPVPELDLASARDQELGLMIQRLEAVAGYRLHVFNCTMENHIPSILALARNVKPSGASLICAAGAHLDPIRAVKSAIFELAAHAKYLDDMYETNRAACMERFRDSGLVREMPDHALAYTVPEAEERIRFLWREDRPLRTFGEEFQPPARAMDLSENLMSLLEKFRRLQMDVIVIDQSSDETRKNGLHCVKVVVPGMLPMTFGHHLRRTTGLERLFRIPKELGYANDRLTQEELNPHPHPFL